ncbi:UNVERIFIED_CONTAM: signal transduction histidine kinase [Acetivibrio alkalicellulosi]
MKVRVFVRLFVLIITILDTTYNKNVSNYEHYILLLLIFVLSSQLRLLFEKKTYVIISIAIDFIILFLFNTTIYITPYFLLIISLTDSLIVFRGRQKIFLALIFFAFLYFLEYNSLDSIFTFLLIFLMIFVFSHYIKKLEKNIKETEILYDENRKYSYELEDTKRKLEIYVKMVERYSQLEERDRISQELHDTIGHKLVSILIQLEATIKINNIDNQKGKDMLYSVRDNLRNCTELLRKVVKNMKPQEISYKIQSIKNMLDDFEKTTGIKIDFKIIGNYQELYPSAQLVIYKNIQESITNSARHGQASHIYITLSFSENNVLLVIKDNGKGCLKITKGMGLTGMEERVKVIGGKMEIKSIGNFEIKTVIPINV